MNFWWSANGIPFPGNPNYTKIWSCSNTISYVYFTRIYTLKSLGWTSNCIGQWFKMLSNRLNHKTHKHRQTLTHKYKTHIHSHIHWSIDKQIYTAIHKHTETHEVLWSNCVQNILNQVEFMPVTYLRKSSFFFRFPFSFTFWNSITLKNTSIYKVIHKGAVRLKWWVKYGKDVEGEHWSSQQVDGGRVKVNTFYLVVPPTVLPCRKLSFYKSL